MTRRRHNFAAIPLTAISVAILIAGCGGSYKSGKIVESGATVDPIHRDQIIAKAAKKLEITIDALTEALGSLPDFSAAAVRLGISVGDLAQALELPLEKLEEALPFFAGKKDD